MNNKMHSTDLKQCWRIANNITEPELRSVGLSAIIQKTYQYLRKQENKKFCEEILAEKKWKKK